MTDELDNILANLDQYERKMTLTPQEVMALFPELQDAKQAIQALIAKECNKARIDEVMNHPSKTNNRWRDDRIKELSDEN